MVAVQWDQLVGEGVGNTVVEVDIALVVGADTGPVVGVDTGPVVGVDTALVEVVVGVEPVPVGATGLVLQPGRVLTTNMHGKFHVHVHVLHKQNVHCTARQHHNVQWPSTKVTIIHKHRCGACTHNTYIGEDGHSEPPMRPSPGVLW